VKIHATWLAVACWAFAPGGALAQPRPATSVQLPTFSFFSVGTTVSVPDRGSVYMGGVKRASTGRNEFGAPLLPFRPFRNTAIGQERSASQMHVTAYIHDFEAMEEALLGQPSSYQGLASRQPLPQIAAAGRPFLSRDPAYGVGLRQSSSLASSAAAPQMSVAEAQARRLREQATRGEEAVDFFRRGRQAEAKGKANVAKIFYQMSARRAAGELKEQVLARLEAIGRAETAAKIARSTP